MTFEPLRQGQGLQATKTLPHTVLAQDSGKGCLYTLASKVTVENLKVMAFA